MSAADLLRELRRLDVDVWLDGNQMRCCGPPGVLTPERREALTARRSEIEALLRVAQSVATPDAIVPIQPAGSRPAFFGVKPELVIKGGFIAGAMMGDGNASIPTPQPVMAPPKPAISPEQDAGMMQKMMDAVGSTVSSLLGNPLLLGGIGAAVLGSFGLLYLRRKRAQQLGAFTASNMAPAAVSAGAATQAVSAEPATSDKKGGLVETGESAFLSEFNKVAPGATDSDDVDPVAEADVYLAYGRDAQAEEILREAMPKDPQRVEIPLKLLEIYAGRKSVEAFESVANNVHAAIGEDHPAWARVCELGRSIDPGNALYGSERAEPSLGSDSALGRNNVISFPERKAGSDGAQEPELNEGLDFDLGFDAAAPAAPKYYGGAVGRWQPEPSIGPVSSIGLRWIFARGRYDSTGVAPPRGALAEPVRPYQIVPADRYPHPSRHRLGG